MRTTLNLDDDVLEMVRQYSEARSASELLRKGFSTRTPTRMVNGIAVFDVPVDDPHVTMERVKALEQELE